MSAELGVTREQRGSFDRTMASLERLCALIGSLAVAFIMLAVVADAVLRWTINQPLTGLLEGSETLMVATVFLGMAYTQSANEHIRVDMLTSRLGTNTRSGIAVNLFGRFLTVLILLLVIYATGQRAIGSWQMREYTMGLMNFPIYPSRTVIPLGFFFMMLRVIIQSIPLIKRMSRAGA